MYSFLRDICGLRKINCIKTIESDIKSRYGWYLSLEEINFMYNEYNNIYKEFWSTINKNINNESNLKDVKFIQPKDNVISFSTIKLDFQKAFTTYSIEMFNDDILKKYIYFCKKTSSLKLPSSAKKFLYNYFLTNLVINEVGKDSLKELRKKVYEDVLYISDKIGDVLKTEIDGSYVICKNNENLKYFYDVYGQFTAKKYKWLMIIDKFLIGKESCNKVIIKGFEKTKPNVLYDFVTDVVSSNSNKDRDFIIDQFMFSNRYPTIDWSYKNLDGNNLNIILKNMKLNLSCDSQDFDIKELNNLNKKINREYYLNEVYPIISFLYEIIG